MSALLMSDDPTTVLAQHRQAERLPGVAAAVAHNGRIVWTGGTGRADIATGSPASADTTWHWFSMTKIATATATMALVDAGRLDLDAPVIEYLPNLLPVPFWSVRVRHLLNHSAGIGNPLPLRWVHPAGAPMPDQRELVSRLLARQKTPAFQPGSRASYSNVGYLVLGEVIAAATGTSYVSHVATNLLRPLGMDATGFAYTPSLMAHAATGYQRTPPGAAWLLRRALPPGIVGDGSGRYTTLEPFELDGPAYGGLIGTVTDAARLVALHTSGGSLDGTRLLSGASISRMQRIDMPGRRYDHGLGWFHRHGPNHGDLRFVEHLGGGGGFHNLMRLYPDLGTGVVVMANTTSRYDAAAIADALATREW